MRALIDARKLDDFGIGTYIRELVRASSSLRPNWDFLLIVTPERIARGELPDLGANVDWIADAAGKYSLREITSLSRQAHQTRADVFHAPHYVYPARLPCPGVVTIHDCIHLRFQEQLPRALGILPRQVSAFYARTMMRHAAGSAHSVIAVSEATRQDLVEQLGVSPERIVTIYNGCDPFFLETADAERGRALRTRLDLPPRYVLFVGNAKPHKNLGRLLIAFEQLAATDTSIELLLVGHIPDVEAISGIAAASRIRHLGFVSREELREIYRSATVLAMPSMYEGFGLPALEAMACGTAVVAGDAGGLPEMAGDAAVLVDPLQVTALKSALHRMINDQAHRDAYGRAGRGRAESFSWHEAAEATVQQYEAAVADTPAAE